MPAYDFLRLRDGERIELRYGFADVPSIGAEVQHPEHGMVRRLPSCLHPSTEDTDPRKRYPVVSRALPRDLPGVPKTAAGHPILRSRKHENEVARRFGFHRHED